MNIPDSIWEVPLLEGTTLGVRSGKITPAIMPLQIAAFTEIWRQRLSDAVVAKDKNRQARIRLLLKFIESQPSDEFALLVWGGQKLTAVFNATSQKVFVME